jgi:hypothetical protein
VESRHTRVADRGYAKGRSFRGGHFIGFPAQVLDDSVKECYRGITMVMDRPDDTSISECITLAGRQRTKIQSWNDARGWGHLTMTWHGRGHGIVGLQSIILLKRGNFHQTLAGGLFMCRPYSTGRTETVGIVTGRQFL